MNQKVLAGVLSVLVLIFSGTTVYFLTAQKSVAPVVQAPVPVSKNLPVAEKVSPVVQNTPIIPAGQDETTGWSTYTNDVYKYQIKHPNNLSTKESILEEFSLPGGSSMTFEEAFAKYTGKICITIGDELRINAPVNNKMDYVMCTSRTGVGADTKIAELSDEKIIIDGVTYDMKKTEFRNAEYHTISYSVTLNDGTRLTFEVAPGAKEDLMKKIIQSYEKIK